MEGEVLLTDVLDCYLLSLSSEKKKKNKYKLIVV